MTKETLDGISKETFLDIARKLENETFQFQPSRRIQIEKPNGSTRPLTIANPRDKIAIEAMRIILTAVFEHTFAETSHGFRPNSSCHSALKLVQQKFKPVT
jgi:retron-type reverse transcriptase